MMDNQTQPVSFTSPLLYHLPLKLQRSLAKLLDSFKTQFAKDEMSIGMANLIKMKINTGTFDPLSQIPFPIAMKCYDWVKVEINKFLTAK